MTTHPNLAVISRYAQGGADLDDATVWSVEVHLEGCADCRARLAGSTAPDTRALLDRVAAAMDEAIVAGPPPAPVRRPWSTGRRRWLVWALGPWLGMTLSVLACALLLTMAWPGLPSLVLLIAPVAPLPGVAVAWSRRADPAWELIVGAPGAGLMMLLRRTATVLAVIVPALALTGAGARQPFALMLLPCLACTAATIGLGGRFGVRRAALAVGGIWVAAVVLPTIVTADVPVVLRPASTPVWALATVALAAYVATRSTDYRWLSSRD
ncbi:hypothetical protein [Actinoplanes sp. NPDC049316]|uniref:hypothetical protein n=1 Tax=Actinoplanes sp. NPDC049316 TaxID=3154727 RepID=UPI00343EDCBC